MTNNRVKVWGTWWLTFTETISRNFAFNLESFCSKIFWSLLDWRVVLHRYVLPLIDTTSCLVSTAPMNIDLYQILLELFIQIFWKAKIVFYFGQISTFDPFATDIFSPCLFTSLPLIFEVADSNRSQVEWKSEHPGVGNRCASQIMEVRPTFQNCVVLTK